MNGPPRKIRELVLFRDRWCLFCGSSRNLEVHHRRIKGIGGDKRAHTDCPCNLVVLCRDCHADAHDDRPWAEDEGYVVERSRLLPGEVGVMRHSDGGGITSRPDCEGGWAA